MSKLWNKVGRVAFWTCLPALYVYLRRGTRTRVLIVSEGKALVIKSWLGTGKWSLPGGGLHVGEDPVVGAVREVREETGIELSPSKLAPMGEAEYSRYGLRFKYHMFTAELPAMRELVLGTPEIGEAAWLSPDKLNIQNADPDVVNLLRLWKDLH